MEVEKSHGDGGGGMGTLMQQDVSTETLKMQQMMEEEDFERRIQQLMFTVVAPTLGPAVQSALRERGHPIQLFGENPANIRQRLSRLLAIEQLQSPSASQPIIDTPTTVVRGDTVTYTHASKELIKARENIFDFSFERVKKRLRREREQRNCRDVLTSDGVTKDYEQLTSLSLEGSHYASTRVLATCCAFDTDKVAVAGWKSQIQIYDTAAEPWNQPLAQTNENSHEDRIMHMACFHNHSQSKTFMASASIDGSAKLWSYSQTENHATDGVTKIEELAHYEGHKGRLCRVSFHPTGKYLATTSFDTTFRLWDCETSNSELLLQDSGHEHATSGLDFHPDGSLILVGDYGSTVRAWDLRSGKALLWGSADSHAGRVLSINCHPTNGRHVATAGDDGTIRLWDLRKTGNKTVPIFSIPAHNRLIPNLTFHPLHGESLLTCSFDGLVKIWNTRTWKCIANLQAHEGAVMDIDFFTNKQTKNTSVVSVGFDKTVKIWK